MSNITYFSKNKLVMINSGLARILFFEVSKETDFPKNFQQFYHTHLFCQRGTFRFKFNDQKMECKSGQFLFWFAESKLSDFKFSKNFKSSVLLIEKDLLINNIPDQGWSINAQLHSRIFPVKTIGSTSEKEKILTNFKQINERFLETSHRFYEEMLKLQTQIFILEMWNLFANEYEKRKHSLQTGNQYEHFIILLQENCLQHREVKFYSDLLNISAKYLNYLSKTHSGITASEWIKRHAKERIILLLQNNNLNISEISEEMNFSSYSYFTRYVKKLLGVTPGEFRGRFNAK